MHHRSVSKQSSLYSFILPMQTKKIKNHTCVAVAQSPNYSEKMVALSKKSTSRQEWHYSRSLSGRVLCISPSGYVSPFGRCHRDPSIDASNHFYASLKMRSNCGSKEFCIKWWNISSGSQRYKTCFVSAPDKRVCPAAKDRFFLSRS